MRLSTPFLLLTLAAIAQENPNQLSSQELAEGWILLFDGETTKGWLEVTGKPFPTSSWRVDHGCLQTTINPGNGLQDLRTAQEFGMSYEFQFDWKIAKGSNSGVKYHVQRVDEWTNAEGRQARARGFEYQLFDDASDPSHDRTKVTGSLYEEIAPTESPARPIGEFNHSLLRLKDGHIEHWLNGVKVVAFDLSSRQGQLAVTRSLGKKPKPVPAPGSFVSLQNHGTPVWFRSLKVRILP